MDVTIVHFLIALLMFHSVIVSSDSDVSQILNDVITDILENGLDQYKNATILSVINNSVFKNAEMDIRSRKLRLSNQLYSNLYEIVTLNENTSKKIFKMIYDIETFSYSIKKSLTKEKNLETLEDIFLSIENEDLTKELGKSLNQLKNLKYKLYTINKVSTKSLVSHEVSEAVGNFSNEDSTEVPPQIKMSWNNDVNYEEPLLESHIDQQCDELEKLHRFSLMVQDELNEMPRSNNAVSEDNMQSESNSQNLLPESPTVPLWLLHERDIEDIQLNYVSWIEIFKQTDREPVKALKEEVAKRGHSITLFCKTLAEFYNLTTKLLECTSKEDTECEKMIVKIMDHQYYEEISQIFTAYAQYNFT